MKLTHAIIAAALVLVGCDSETPSAPPGNVQALPSCADEPPPAGVESCR